METVLDVVPPFALQCIVVGSLVGLRGVGGACTYTHTHTEWGREGGGGHGAFSFPVAQLPAVAELGLSLEVGAGGGEAVSHPPECLTAPVAHSVASVYAQRARPHLRPLSLRQLSGKRQPHAAQREPTEKRLQKRHPPSQPHKFTRLPHKAGTALLLTPPDSPCLMPQPPPRRTLNIASTGIITPQSKDTSITWPRRCVSQPPKPNCVHFLPPPPPRQSILLSASQTHPKHNPTPPKQSHSCPPSPKATAPKKHPCESPITTAPPFPSKHRPSP